jgi:hypothetical protein
VGKLPPDEQRKAQLIVSQMNDALTRQGKVVGDYAERADEAQRDLTEHTADMAEGLASVPGDLAGLRSLPGDVKDLEAATHRNPWARAPSSCGALLRSYALPNDCRSGRGKNSAT